MRIESLDLTAFGHFADQRLNFGALSGEGTDLHLIYGPNEAGKSTTLAAIAELLFGMPRSRTPWAFRHDNALLELGARLYANGEHLEVRRLKNRLLDAGGQTLDPSRIDTQGLSLDDYRARFSMDEQTLETGGKAILAQKGELGAALFSAAAGLADLDKRLQRAMEPADAFYLPKKRTKIELLAYKEQLAKIDETLIDDVDTKDWIELRTATENARERYAEQERHVADLHTEVSALERRLRAVSAAERRRELITQLKEHADLPTLADAALMTFDRDLVAHNEARVALDSTETRLSELSEKRKAVVLDEAALTHQDAIAGLATARIVLAERRAELPVANEALADAEQRCRALASELELPDDAVQNERLVPDDVISKLEALAREHAAVLTQLDNATRERRALDDDADNPKDESISEMTPESAHETTLETPPETTPETTPEKAPETPLETPPATAPLTAPLTAIETPPDTTLLSRYIDSLSQEPPWIAHQTLTDRQSALGAQVERALASLAPWSGTADALTRQAPPEHADLLALQARVDTLASEMSELDKEARRLSEELASAVDQQETLQDVNVVDDDRLIALRSARNELLDALRGHIQEQASVPSLLGDLDRIEITIEQLDTAADDRVAHGDTLAQLRTLRRDRARIERRLKRAVELREANQLTHTELQAEINQIANTLGLDKTTLPGITAWLERRASALAQVDELATLTGEHASSKADIEKRAQRLAELLAPIHPAQTVDALAGIPLEELLPLARDALTLQRQQVERSQRASEQRRERIVERDRRQKALNLAVDAHTQWREQWTDTVGHRTSLSGDPELVIGRLATWRRFSAAMRALDEQRDKIAHVQQATASFVQHAKDTLSSLARAEVTAEKPSARVLASDDASTNTVADPNRQTDATANARISEHPDTPIGEQAPSTQEAEAVIAQVIALEARLVRAQQSASDAQRLQTDIDTQRTRRDQARDTLTPLAAQLETLRVNTAAGQVSDLPAIVERLRQRNQLSGRLGETEAGLREALGTDDIDAALKAHETLDRDALEAELALRSERLAAERSELAERFASVKSAEHRQSMLDDNASAAARQAERANVLLEIESRALETLQLRLGKLALESGLNRFREQNRSGMLDHARQAFVAMTNGHFTDLRARPGDGGQDHLVAVRSDGGLLDTTGMSTGTRRQLFLSLRIAAWQEYAKRRTPLPFVADDVLESFDEPRSSAAFGLFGEMARRGQIIYLTHHQHMVELARAAVPSVQVHELPARTQ